LVKRSSNSPVNQICRQTHRYGFTTPPSRLLCKSVIKFAAPTVVLTQSLFCIRSIAESKASNPPAFYCLCSPALSRASTVKVCGSKTHAGFVLKHIRQCHYMDFLSDPPSIRKRLAMEVIAI